MSPARERGLPLEGPEAPPRANGELVFAAPWESRAFGMAVSLHERGVFEWGEFRTLLVEEIGNWERGHPDGEAYRYYARWLASLERLMLRKRLCSAAEVDARLAVLAARPHGHDHEPS